MASIVSKPAQRHEKFYYLDGSIILKAENILYKVYGGLLGLKSEFFGTLISLPQAEGADPSTLDGRSDETAVVLFHTAAEVDALFKFFFNEWSTEIPTIDELCAVLKLGTFYAADSAREYSIHHLSSHPELKPSLRLHLACEYKIKQWVDVAFRELMSISILKVTDEDRALIGSEAYHILATTHANVDLHRRRLAFNPPKAIHSVYCPDEQDCSQTWRQAWWGAHDRDGILTALLHPSLSVPGRVIDAALEDLQVDWAMRDECRVLTISSIQGTTEKAGRLAMEDMYITKGVAALLKMM